MKITSCVITDPPNTYLDPQAKVVATFEDGKIIDLFEFYYDEVQFAQEQFIGLTFEEALDLRLETDLKYLRSE